MISTNSKDNLTWSEIAAKYPDQWVGLTNVVREDDGVTVASAVVSKLGTMDELFESQLDHEVEYCSYTTPDRSLSCPVFTLS